MVRAAEACARPAPRVEIVCLGSSPTALHAATCGGITDMRAGRLHVRRSVPGAARHAPPEDIAVTVLASVIGRKPARSALLLDAGALALRKDRSTEKAPRDYGFGLVLDMDGGRCRRAHRARVHQEHGEVRGGPLPRCCPSARGCAWRPTIPA